MPTKSKTGRKNWKFGEVIETKRSIAMNLSVSRFHRTMMRARSVNYGGSVSRYITQLVEADYKASTSGVQLTDPTLLGAYEAMESVFGELQMLANRIEWAMSVLKHTEMFKKDSLAIRTQKVDEILERIHTRNMRRLE